ncbi:MAG: hypothetical protein ACRDLT_07595 [Solirubrobacteraceae bacterium]
MRIAKVQIQARDAHEAGQAERRAGRLPGQKLWMPPHPWTPPTVPEGVMNKTDPGSRLMRTQGPQTIQGYNPQAAVTRGQIIVAAEIAVEAPSSGISSQRLANSIPPRSGNAQRRCCRWN